MRKALIILIVLFGVFLAIGCAGNKPVTPNETVTPVQAETPVEVVTPTEAETPVEVVTETEAKMPVTAVTPAENYTENYTTTKNQSATGNVTKNVGSTARKLARIQQTPAGNITGTTDGVIKVTPNKGD